MAADRVIYGSRVGGRGVTQHRFFKHLKKRDFSASPQGCSVTLCCYRSIFAVPGRSGCYADETGLIGATPVARLKRSN
jgi:hypothetical protein